MSVVTVPVSGEYDVTSQPLREVVTIECDICGYKGQTVGFGHGVCPCSHEGLEQVAPGQEVLDVDGALEA